MDFLKMFAMTLGRQILLKGQLVLGDKLSDRPNT